jgi:hypothetical protein
MALPQRHIAHYKEIFGLPSFFSEPVLLFGLQEISIHKLYYRPYGQLTFSEKLQKLRRALRHRYNVARGVAHPDLEIPPEFRFPDLVTYLRSRGIQEIEVLDHFDRRASLQYDMNAPVPDQEHERYGTLIDVGCLEHVFDTRQCLENCLRMVRTGGIYFLCTCVNGYLRHGLHVFNPEGLVDALKQNGFEIVYCRYSTSRGGPISDPSEWRNALIWLVGRKTRALKKFNPPQQAVWEDAYVSVASPGVPALGGRRGSA